MIKTSPQEMNPAIKSFINNAIGSLLRSFKYTTNRINTTGSAAKSSSIPKYPVI